MPRDMCDAPLSTAETFEKRPVDLVVFDYDDNLVFAHETLGYRLPFRFVTSAWMMRDVTSTAQPAGPTGEYQARFEQVLRDGLRVF